ncbi:zinc-dependent peptidase [Pusillimonas sp. MFBS29]|uniref:M90 family metallopeptidase n=1 Tax=Pusillimonas sp. MFBS29 TaxID=2886690 RepID=UPI001D1040F6|nr:M90 family metallopeptidase [Pusillimonas sp. MFBS29]MCC2597086.1 zinc-dependent peptidase [Pusillimonas sp. MFBS29]
MFRWLAGRGASSRKVSNELAQISPEVWLSVVGALPFLGGLSHAENEALRQRAAWLLASKNFSAAQGLVLTDQIMLSIAAQAALPVLNLNPALYEGWIDIIVYPGGFLTPRVEVDESGVVHEYMAEASGEAWEGGPVILSWEDAGPGREPANNVVIHEFAHKLDQYGSDTDGMPNLAAHPELEPRRWSKTLDESLSAFTRALDALEASIPEDVDPESEEGQVWYDSLPLDPYAATDEAEFFAVSSEAFFVDPLQLCTSLPQWYALLAQYYRQDPLRRLASV